MGINELWSNIINNYLGYEFHTRRQLPFTLEYKDTNSVYVNRNGKYVRIISKSNMEFILNNPNEYFKTYSENMQCASYALVVYETLIKLLR